MLTNNEAVKVLGLIEYLNANMGATEVSPGAIELFDMNGERVATVGWDGEAGEYVIKEVPVA